MKHNNLATVENTKYNTQSDTNQISGIVNGYPVKLNFAEKADHNILNDIKRAILLGAIKCEIS